MVTMGAEKIKTFSSTLDNLRLGLVTLIKCNYLLTLSLPRGMYINLTQINSLHEKNTSNCSPQTKINFFPALLQIVNFVLTVIKCKVYNFFSLY